MHPPCFAHPCQGGAAEAWHTVYLPMERTCLEIECWISMPHTPIKDWQNLALLVHTSTEQADFNS